MDLRITHRRIDCIVVTLANLLNIIMVFIFYVRTRGAGHPLVFGIVWGVLIVVLTAAFIMNIRSKRPWWSFILPMLLAIFLIVELMLDYVLQIEFRSTKLLGPYLLLYYVSIMGMIGYAFLTEKRLGFITLVTYFASQIAALYSYINVGHG